MRDVIARSLAALAALLLVGCAGGQPEPSGPGGQISVVTTTTVFADLVRQVGGERVSVSALVPAGGEAHTFEPAPSDARRVEDGALLVMNGLGLDDWLLSFLSGIGKPQSAVLQLGPSLADAGVVELIGDNPHLWMNVAYARLYVGLIRDRLSAVDPDGAPTYRDNAAAYDAQLAELDGWIRMQYADVPQDHRQVIAFHDAFPYYAQAYGLDTLGVILEAPGQDPSATQIARLISAIRDNGVEAILAEEQFSDRLAQVVASDTQATVVHDLYTDSLGDAPLDSYTAIMRYDTQRIVEALQ